MKLALRIYAFLFSLLAISTILMPMDHYGAKAIIVKLGNIFAYSTVAFGVAIYAFDTRFFSNTFWRYFGIFWVVWCAVGAAVYLYNRWSTPEGVQPTSFAITWLIIVFNYFLIHKLRKSLATA